MASYTTNFSSWPSLDALLSAGDAYHSSTEFAAAQSAIANLRSRLTATPSSVTATSSTSITLYYSGSAVAYVSGYNFGTQSAVITRMEFTDGQSTITLVGSIGVDPNTGDLVGSFTSESVRVAGLYAEFAGQIPVDGSPAVLTSCSATIPTGLGDVSAFATGSFVYSGDPVSSTGTYSSTRFWDDAGHSIDLTGLNYVDSSDPESAPDTPQELRDMLSGDDTAYGTSGNQELRTFAGNDTLDGMAGADTMGGGSGDDTYVVDNAGDVVVELASNGHDGVRSLVSFTLPDHVEDLVLSGLAWTNGSGNAGDNQITGNAAPNGLFGNAGSDTLDGGEGIDTMYGGAGDDIYIVSQSLTGRLDSLDLWGDPGAYYASGQERQIPFQADQIWSILQDANADGIVDYLYLSLSSNPWFSLTVGTNKLGQNLLPGTYLNAERAAFASAGHPGLDLAVDGLGANQVTGAFSLHAIDIDYSGASPRLVSLALSFEIHPEHIAPATYGYLNYNNTGNLSTPDTIVELPDEGRDEVRSGMSFALPANVEDLALTGNADLYGIGNELANVLGGNDGNNSLEGGAGNDTLLGGDGNDRLDGGRGADRMEGGSGNDLYVVDHRSDQITEFADSGIDSVSAKVSHSLADNIENLYLTGSVTLRSGGFFGRKTTSFDLSIDGTGNAADNLLRGNRGHNQLDGLGGNDTLLGGAGADVLQGGTGADRLVGGAGADVFVFAAGDGGAGLAAADMLYDFEDGIDRIMLAGGLDFAGLSITQGNGIDTAVSNTVIGTGSGEYLVVLLNVSPGSITAADFYSLGI